MNFIDGGNFFDPVVQQKIFIIELEVNYEFKEELIKANWWQKFFIERKIKKEIKKRIDAKFGSDYSLY